MCAIWRNIRGFIGIPLNRPGLVLEQITDMGYILNLYGRTHVVVGAAGPAGLQISCTATDHIAS